MEPHMVDVIYVAHVEVTSTGELGFSEKSSL